MLKTDKERIVTELAEELGAADTLIVADYRGLTNKQLEALRDQLLEHGARFRIVKNTLTRRAAEQAGADALLVMLEGPTAIAFIESAGDPAAVAKALAQTARETNVLALRGGILEGKTLSSEQVAELATLPPVDVLRGQLVGAIVAPLTQLLAILSAPLQDLHGLIDARIAQLGDSAGAESPGADESGVAEEDAPGPAPGDAPGEPESSAAESPGADESGVAEEDAPGPAPGDEPVEPEGSAPEVPAETGEDQAEAAAQPEREEPGVTAQEDESQESDLDVSAEAETSAEQEDS